jgi:hypothetical protein
MRSKLDGSPGIESMSISLLIGLTLIGLIFLLCEWAMTLRKKTSKIDSTGEIK